MKQERKVSPSQTDRPAFVDAAAQPGRSAGRSGKKEESETEKISARMPRRSRLDVFIENDLYERQSI
ncbi:MAG TPA: hypothetical protein VHK69_07110 [Chitinophagaceae bacterium]|jgi:hypothetical protein|nr:hypothetical protein [Chitinophagaceae bacterium]